MPGRGTRCCSAAMASSCTGSPRSRWARPPRAAPEKNLRSDVEALLAMVGPATRILYLGNPNNPTGSYLTAAALKDFRRRLPAEVLLVIDAAYAEYVEAAD